ncbi:quinone oxidoreductase family protein [Actinoalloteichus hymeniacidonis]|uniref:Zn-dependent oxidoreductase, NADPH:quinone reductase n=1 Tax=Actinoalloteichus hymeniacidonis TaxID=340345 RepID=A0AAC9HUC5_9PSEU|nr:zinc-binding dehydrogenase [Actinoalloteichus hymeniacidonis]AOS65628.1 Zn-dependent oxidoreductase, NADPH:quinone reductase [Actinoalloteichus hymeniacidonis]MBB5906281.1 NADPH:quinone reductase-like Zn-dependent oxidoreductase [Actinoalloteichus hymeniacidonis]
MRAVIVESFEDPVQVVVRERPDPVAAAGQVVVRTQSIGVGYVDVRAARGHYPYFPGRGASLGLEVVGVVESCGAGVDTDLLGRRVLGLPQFGGFAELVVVNSDRVFVLDSADDTDEAVALGLNALVAEIGLRRAGLAPADRVLVRGAGGSIGVLATQIAAASGAHVTAVTSSASRAQRLLTLGATHAVQRDEVTNGEADFDLIVDTVAGADLSAHLRLLAPYGRYLLCGAAGGNPIGSEFETIMEIYHRSPTLLAFSLNTASAPELRTSWKRVSDLAHHGLLRGPIQARYPLASAMEALRSLEQGGVFGKVLLTP